MKEVGAMWADCQAWFMIWKSKMPADEQILILQRRGLGKRPRSRMIKRASEFKSRTVVSDHSLPSMPNFLGKDRLM